MSKIVIVGSKPNPSIQVIEQGDVVVLVNGSIEHALKLKVKSMCHAVSDYIFESEQRELVKVLLNNMQGVSVDCLIVFESRFSNLSDEEIKEKLNRIDYKFNKLIRVSLVDKNKLYFFGVGFNFFNVVFGNGVVQGIKELFFFIYKRQPRKKIKPSTGINAYLYIKKNFKMERVLCVGIGVDNDGYSYIDGKYDRGHLNYDREIILRDKSNFLDV